MRSLKVIILSLIGILLLGTVSYFAFYIPHVHKVLAANQQACADLESIFRQNYTELYATSTLSNDPADIAIESHYSSNISKCYIKIQRHDKMKYSYTSTDKTILYDVAEDKSVANCTTILQREIAVGTECSQGDTKITQEEFGALKREYMQN